MKDTLQFRMTSPLTKARLTDSVRTIFATWAVQSKVFPKKRIL